MTMKANKRKISLVALRIYINIYSYTKYVYHIAFFGLQQE